MTAVSTLFNNLLRTATGIEDVDFSQLDPQVSGAMPAPAERGRALAGDHEEPGGRGLRERTPPETSPVVCCNPLDGTGRLGTIGLPFPSTEVRLVDEDGHEVEAGRPGELCVRGPQVMKGYWKQPEETAKVLQHGWLGLATSRRWTRTASSASSIGRRT